MFHHRFARTGVSAPLSFSWKDFPVPENHGSASAAGARIAVVAVRRVLLLLAFLVGALCALWIAGAYSAQAQERPGGSVDVLSAVDEVGDTAEPLPLRESVPDTVAGVGERAVQAVADTSETTTRAADEADALVERSTLGRQAREAGHEILVSTPEAESAAEPAAPGLVEETSEEETPVVEDERPVEREPRPESDDGTDASMSVDSVIGEASEHEPHEPHESAVPSPHGATTGASGGSVGGPTAGGTVAGYLAPLGIPAPDPGVLDAVRHALRAVPADTADESTFSPD